MEALLTIVSGIAGTILGFFLSEWAQSRREKRTGRREADSARILLRQEAATNLRRLEELWRRIMQGQTQPSPKACARRFVELPFAGFTDEVWKSQLPIIPAELSSREIQAANMFYERLRALEALRATLAKADARQKEEWSRASGGTGLVSTSNAMHVPKDLDRLAGELWPECERLEAEIRGIGIAIADR